MRLAPSVVQREGCTVADRDSRQAAAVAPSRLLFAAAEGHGHPTWFIPRGHVVRLHAPQPLAESHMDRPHENARDLIVRATALMVEAFDALAREAAGLAAVKAEHEDLQPAFKLARERGFTPAAISRWCLEHPELGAKRSGPRGRWYVSRKALNDFLTHSGRRRSPRARRRHLTAVEAA